MARVSVIMPCYNAAAHIGEALRSVLRQTHADVEIIVVDDGSTDDTVAIVRALGDGIRLELSPHGGACRARNRGLELATGRHALFLDADDVLRDDALAALVDVLATAPARAAAACPWQRLRHSDGRWRIRPSESAAPPVGDDPLERWLVGGRIPPGAMLWPVEVVRELGGWDETLHAAQDMDFCLRAFLAGVKLVETRRGMFYYRDHGAASRSVSAKRSPEHLRSRMRMCARIEAGLVATGRLERYRVALGVYYHVAAHLFFVAQPELARECDRRSRALGGSRAIAGSFSHRVLTRLLGLPRKEWLARWLARAGIGRRLRLGRPRDIADP